MKTQLNLIYLFILFSAISCTESDLPVQEYIEGEKEAVECMFLNLALAASDPYSTRYDADEVATYEGFEYESGILNGKVYIFEGTSENDAKCVSSGIIPFDNSHTILNSTQFSTEKIPCRNIAIETFIMDPSKKYYALVVLNACEGITQETDGVVTEIEAPFIGPAKGESFKSWAKTPQRCQMVVENGKYSPPNMSAKYPAYFPTMVNATGMTGYNSTSDFEPQTLVEISPEDFSVTPISDSDPISTVVYVLRNVARVVVIPGDNLNYEAKQVIVGNWTEAEVNILNWRLDVTNLSSYPVMNTDGLSFEKSFFHLGDIEYERSLWAIDPNYDDPTKTSSDFYRASRPGVDNGTTKVPKYCLENTFNTECMLQGQTTRIVVIGKWAFDETSPENPDKYLGKMTAECRSSIAEPSVTDSNDFYMIEKQDSIWCRFHIEETLKKKAEKLYGSQEGVDITWTQRFAGGYFSLKDILTVTQNNNEISAEDFDKLATSLGLENASSSKIAYYKNCQTYYVKRIPHFKDSDTPWDVATEVKQKNIGGKDIFIADYDEDKHLGRYGVVRNYSYEITVTGIHSMGSPSLPDINDELTDDMPEDFYMTTEVKVQAWAKRDITIGF